MFWRLVNIRSDEADEAKKNKHSCVQLHFVVYVGIFYVIL